MYLICVLENMRESMEKENFLLPIFSPEAFNAGNSLESFETNEKVFLPSIWKIFTLSICFQSVNFKSPPSLKFLNIGKILMVNNQRLQCSASSSIFKNSQI